MMKVKTTTAAILVEQNKPLVVDEIELPSSLDIGQVLVHIHYSGICGSQLGEISGAKGPDKYLPHLLGHEASATVLETGPGVKTVQPGDYVVLHWRKGLGIEANPPRYIWRGQVVNAGWITTFNRHAIIAENRMTKVDAKVPPKLAALYGCAITTGFGVIENNAQVRIGESVVVFGAGGVGLNIVQAATLVGAKIIIALDIFDGRLDLARRFGATHTINTQGTDYKTAISECLQGENLDVFIDNTGIPEIIRYGYNSVSPQGRVVLVGVPRKGSDIAIHSLPLHFGKKISGSHGGEAEPALDIKRYSEYLAAKKIDLASLITNIYTLENVNDAIDDMRSGAASGRCMISMG